jgi:hypothetical protein
VIHAAITLPWAVEPDDRNDPVAQVNPAASKLGALAAPPEVAAELPELAADDIAELAADDAAELAADDAAEVAADVAAEVVEEAELLLVPHAARVMAPAATSAASAVILVFFTRMCLSRWGVGRSALARWRASVRCKR